MTTHMLISLGKIMILLFPLEVHKCRRDYLFNLSKCKEYFNKLNTDNEKMEEALIILNQIEQLL